MKAGVTDHVWTLSENVGSRAGPEVIRKELHDLLVDMRDGLPAPQCVVIRWCSTIEAHAAALCELAPSDYERIESPEDPSRALYHRLHGANDLESLVEPLWTLYSDPLSKGHFSRDPHAHDADDKCESSRIGSVSVSGRR